MILRPDCYVNVYADGKFGAAYPSRAEADQALAANLANPNRGNLSPERVGVLVGKIMPVR